MTYRITPDTVSGYNLNPRKGSWSVIVPERKTNMVRNPSFEVAFGTGDDGYTAVSVGTIARSTDKQQYGVYSMKYTPSANTGDGVYYSFDGSGTIPPIRFVAGELYSASVSFYSDSNIEYRFRIFDLQSNTNIAYISFRGCGEWRRYSITGKAGIAFGGGTQHEVYIQKVDSTDLTPFYIDGFQVEQGLPTTYIDGDQLGFGNELAYFWTGQPHKSASTRSERTRAGGRLITFDDLQFDVNGVYGLGMAQAANIFEPLGLTGQSYFQRYVTPSRTFAITGSLYGRNLQELQRNRAKMIDVLRPNKTPQPQPLILHYQQYDCDTPIGPNYEIVATYNGGLEGALNNNHQDAVAIQFTMPDPYPHKVTDSGVETTDVKQSIPNEFLSKRSPDGQWQEVFAYFITNLDVYAFAEGPDGYLYIGGDFTTTTDLVNVGQVVNRIAYWDGTQFFDIDAGVNGLVRCIVFDTMGNLYIGGDFTSVGTGPTAASYIAKWDGATWSSLGTPQGANDTVHALAFDDEGFLIVGGEFTSIGGVAASKIARYNPTADTFATYVSGTNGDVFAILPVNGGATMYVGGAFTTAGSGPTTVNYVFSTDGTTVSALGLGTTKGVGATVRALAQNTNGAILIGGAFTTAGGLNINRIVQWDGTAFYGLDRGIDEASDSVLSIAVDPLTGFIYAGGSFSQVDSTHPLKDGFAGFNGSKWFQPDVDLDDVTVRAIHIRDDGELFLGFSNSANDGVGVVLLECENEGNADAYPIFYLTGENAFIYSITNYVTRQSIFFDWLQVLEGEIIILDLRPSRKTFVSNLRGNLQSRILTGSDLTDFRLQAGPNTLAIHAPYEVGASNTSVRVVWKDTYWGVEGADSVE